MLARRHAALFTYAAAGNDSTRYQAPCTHTPPLVQRVVRSTTTLAGKIALMRMNRTVRETAFATLLAVASSNAMAAWTEVFHDESVTVYAAPTSSAKAGDRARIWVLYDYKMPQPASPNSTYRSSRSQSEYDCKARRSRVLFLTGHSGPMAMGDTVFSLLTADDWTPVTSDSLGEFLWKVACTKS